MCESPFRKYGKLIYIQLFKIFFELFPDLRMLKTELYCGFDVVEFIARIEPFAFKDFPIKAASVFQ